MLRHRAGPRSAGERFFAAEHFGVAVQPWSLRGRTHPAPGTGELLGVVDLTGTDEVASPQALALVRATAAAAEAELALRAQARTALTPTTRTCPRVVAAAPSRPEACGSAVSAGGPGC